MSNRKRQPTAERDSQGRLRASRRKPPRPRVRETCAWCSASLEGKRWDAKTCSDYCSNRAYYRANRESVLAQTGAYGKRKTLERQQVRAATPKAMCACEGCDQEAKPKSRWCGIHYQRVRKTGSPGEGARLRAPIARPVAPPPGSVDDTERCAWWEAPCDHDVYSQDLCKRHYGRAREMDKLPPKFSVFTGLTAHWLSDLDEAALVATCAVCGPQVPVARHKKGDSGRARILCSFSRNADSRKRGTGWSEIEYDLALIAQGNRCAICHKPPVGRGLHGVLHADHSHAEQRRRALLCGKCNHMLGMAEDDPQVLIAAANYLATQAGVPRLF